MKRLENHSLCSAEGYLAPKADVVFVSHRQVPVKASATKVPEQDGTYSPQIEEFGWSPIEWE